MIVVLCANPALDVTYRLDRLVPGSVHRTAEVTTRAGGKGANVACVLRQLGHPVRLIAPLGGQARETFAELFGDDLQAVPVGVPTRSSVTLLDADGATVINETGCALRGDDWSRVVAAVTAQVAPGDVVVLSGSLPPGVPLDAYGRLVDALRGARCIVDCAGDALVGAVSARPAVAAPNVLEVADALGRPGLSAPDAAVSLQHLGAVAAVVSDGAAGLCAAVGGEVLRATPPRHVQGNPTGAGDALTAALAAGLHTGLRWPQVLRDAVATSAAAVATPVAGEVDEALLQEFRDHARPVTSGLR